MKRKQFLTVLMAVAAMAGTNSCTTQKPAARTASDVTATVPVSHTETSQKVVPNPQFISIAEAADALASPELLASLASRYGYKTIRGYGVHRLDNYDMMLYKNCTLPTPMGNNVYADTPRPAKKGTSSYVALNRSLTIGVFNNTAYENLVGQVKSCGFTLAEEGYEDRYTNGTVDVYCYKTRRTVRLEKTAGF